MKIPQDSALQSAHNLLHLADEQMKKNQHDQALKFVRQVYDTDPKNVYARAYEERILMAIAEKKAQQEAETLLSMRMRDFIAEQERKGGRKEELVGIAEKQDPVMKEIDESLQTAKERLYEVILTRSANPEEAGKQAKETVNRLVDELKHRLEKIRTIMTDHEQQILQSRQQEHSSQTRKLYRSLAYMMQKLGVSFEHRDPLLHLVSFYAGFTANDEKELKHNAALGIYEDLLKQIYFQGEPNEENLAILGKTREHFSISDMEHHALLAHAKNELLLTEKIPVLAVIDPNPQIGQFVMDAVRTEFPKTHVHAFASPEEFLKKFENDPPHIVICSTMFEGSSEQGFDLCKRMKEHPKSKEGSTSFVVMLEATDEFFREAVDQLGLGKIIQKPFSRELLMWTLRPFIFRASGAPVAPV